MLPVNSKSVKYEVVRLNTEFTRKVIRYLYVTRNKSINNILNHFNDVTYGIAKAV